MIINWCKSTSLKISPSKTQLMNIGKYEYNEEITIDGQKIEKIKSIKYLGVMLSKEMKWKEHLNLIEEKISKCNNAFGMMKFMCKTINLERKIILLNQVANPIIKYAYKVWYADVKFKYQSDKLKRIQRSVLLKLSGAYRTSGNTKLLNIFGQLEINRSIILDLKYSKDQKNEKRENYSSELRIQGYSEEDKALEQSTSKELIWFKLGHGPFLKYLRNIKISEESICSFCNEEEESANHLLFECSHFGNLKNINNLRENCIEELDKKARKIVIEIYKREENS